MQETCPGVAELWEHHILARCGLKGGKLGREQVGGQPRTLGCAHVHRRSVPVRDHEHRGIRPRDESEGVLVIDSSPDMRGPRHARAAYRPFRRF
jgi:hypothetical protein